MQSQRAGISLGVLLESFQWEKPSKVSESNHEPSTAHLLMPVPWSPPLSLCLWSWKKLSAVKKNGQNAVYKHLAFE